MGDAGDDKYEVGYCKPPKTGQFPEGKSGNPKGRPKGANDIKTILRKQLSAKVSITENGKKRRVSTLSATVMRMQERALKGDMRAIEKVLSLAWDMATELERQQNARSMGLKDAEIMERFKASVRASKTNPTSDGAEHDG